ncbi:hypothetical protein BH09DEP1_BH09DEP1_6660 [soil metagenome]
MKRILLLLLCLAAPIFSTAAKKKSANSKSIHAITYHIEEWRRLGDAITTLCKTLYFAKMHKLPIYFKGFPYFDQFAISQNAQMLTPEVAQQFPKKIPIAAHTDIATHLESTEPILFECQFLSETPAMYSVTREYPEFEELIKQAFTPLIDIPQLAKPPAVITVALHVRKGGGFDKPLGSRQEYGSELTLPKGIYLKKNSPQGSHFDAWHIKWPASKMFIEVVKHYIYKKTNFSDYVWPIKFPCDQYYIDQLKELSSMMPGKNLLVYLFTDDPEPEKIMERYSNQLKDHPRIIFSYRTKDNHHTKNVIEDLFSLTQCDCLISASSSFATAAQLLGKHQVIMFPLWAVTLPDKIIINKVGVITIHNHLDAQAHKINYREIAHKLK